MESGRDLDSSEKSDAVIEPTAAATYKSLPDDDRDWHRKSTNSTMGKTNGENEIDDGAQEQMLKNENKITPTKNATEIKFISENGEAKIDMECVKQVLCGMSKDELMKYANDPFWIRLRWFLFLAFWLLWVAMLAGAIAIIVLAPKCSVPQDKKWFEESPIVQIDILDLPNQNLKEIEPILDDLKKKNIKAISLTSVVKGSSEGLTEDFKDINSEIGQMRDLEDIIKAAKDRNQHIILELDPNHSSVEHPWFKQSIQRKDPYTDYYVWSDGKVNSDGKRIPPNNWLSVNGGSAWEWNAQRGQYYFHQFNSTQADLNFNNDAVITEFGEILVHWLKLGVSGFRLANIPYLTEDPNLNDEHATSKVFDADNYQSLVHVHTRDREETAQVLMKWHEIVYNETKGQGLFALQDEIGADILGVFNDKRTLIDIPQSSQFLAITDTHINATTLDKSIRQWLNISSWPGWNLNENVRQQLPSDVRNSLMLMTLLLPGTPILKLNDTKEVGDAFMTLTNARSGKTFLHGEIFMEVINGNTFVYTRLKSGNPGYLVAYHDGDEPTAIDLSVIPQVSDEVNVLAHSSNYILNNDMGAKLPSNNVPMSAKSTLVLTFVPKS